MAPQGQALITTAAGVYGALTDQQTELVTDALERRAGWSTSISLVSKVLRETGIEDAVAFEYALILCRGRGMAWAHSPKLGALRSS